MIYLLISSLIWGFSFGLIKGQLTDLDPNLVSSIRILISLLIFLPVMRLKKIKDPKLCLHLLVIGAVQFGLMYVTYIYAFRFLNAYEVALFTILTPIYVTIINDMLNKRFEYISFISALVAILGAAIIVYSKLDSADFISGFMMVQVSNLCFASGQVYYKKLMAKHSSIKSSDVFALMCMGALAITALFTFATVDFETIKINNQQLISLLYLGLIASGLGFYLWTVGTTKAKISSLAIMNNAKIPLAVLISIFVFGETSNWTRLIIGGGLMLTSVIISEKYSSNKRLV
jgi:drug/metabolite transporter (DMT)-like permease